MSGCRGCEHQALSKQSVQIDQAEAPFRLSLKKLSSYSRFSFSSQLSLSLVAGLKQQVFSEQISLDVVNGLFRFSKKIDAAHYLEIISDGSRYAVKNRQGPWRDGRDNKAFLAEVIDDGLNLSSWLLDQCGIASSAQINTQLSSDAAFIKSMPPEAGIRDCKLKATISLEASELELNCAANDGSLQLSARTKLLENNDLAEIALPDIIENEPLLYPVNIAPKLLDLLKQETR